MNIKELKELNEKLKKTTLIYVREKDKNRLKKLADDFGVNMIDMFEYMLNLYEKTKK